MGSVPYGKCLYLLLDFVMNLKLPKSKIFFFLAVLRFELRGLMLARHTLPLESLHQPFFVLGIFKIGSHELFAQC
jgi:hypothetical protein